MHGATRIDLPQDFCHERSLSAPPLQDRSLSLAAEAPLSIADQGYFSAGGTTITSEGTFDPANQ